MSQAKQTVLIVDDEINILKKKDCIKSTVKPDTTQ